MFNTGIKAYAEQRKIPYLVHFTRLENLHSILRWGILSRMYMSIHGIKAIVNDVERLDRRANASCLSISFPNNKMLFKYKESQPSSTWVILLLDSSLLWKADCAFCYTNAANKTISRTDTDVLRGVEALKGLFAQTVGNIDRPTEHVAIFDPTDVQAEVLAFEPVDTQFIRGIRFKDRSTYENVLPDINDKYLDMTSWDKSLFLPRMTARRLAENAKA